MENAKSKTPSITHSTQINAQTIMPTMEKNADPERKRGRGAMESVGHAICINLASVFFLERKPQYLQET
jgi:hypothetical protein